MTLVEDIISQIEEQESYEDMHFSLFSIPKYYQPEEQYVPHNYRINHPESD